MRNREFLQLAKIMGDDVYIGNWFASEKIDGERCFWDGGVTRGMLKSLVPWANLIGDERYTEPQVSTGLWTRYGNVIHAPDKFIDMLPPSPLDGELWVPGMSRQQVHSIIKTIIPDESRWQHVGYYLFDMPPLECVFDDGRINNNNFKKVIVKSECMAMYKSWEGYTPPSNCRFETRLKLMHMKVTQCDNLIVHKQMVLPMKQADAMEEATRLFDIAIAKPNGEGLILRAMHAPYHVKRTPLMVKMKDVDDMEGTVIGYTTAREGKLEGMMGAAILQLDNGIVLNLSGFEHGERRLCSDEATNWALDNMETKLPDRFSNPLFPRGSRITFRYRNLTDAGVPSEARYFRKREEI